MRRYLPWAAQATLEYRSQAGHWDDAIRLLEQQRAARVIEKQEADRLRGVLLTARAGDKLESDPAGARDDATYALKLIRRFRTCRDHRRQGAFSRGQTAQGRLDPRAGMESSDRILRSAALMFSPEAAIPPSIA